MQEVAMNQATRASLATILAGLLCVLLAGPALAQRTYGLDEDPIRVGNKALAAGQLQEAQGAFLQAVADGYQVYRAKLGLAEVAVRQGRYEEAEPLFREAIDLRQQDKDAFPEAHAALGLLLLRKGRQAEARQELEEALKEDHDLWPAQYGLARFALAEQKWEEARKLLEKGSSRHGVGEGEDLYHHGMALYYLGKGQLQDAEKESLLALHQNPMDPQYGLLVARIYKQHGAPTLAIEAFEKTLKTPGLQPTAPMLHTLGQLYQEVGRYNEARQEYTRAVEIDSTYAPALADLARLFQMADQPDLAARTYLRYVMIEPDDLQALLGLAETCLETGRYGQAVEAARAAMALDDTSMPAKKAFARAGLHSREDGVRAQAAQIFSALPDTVGWQASDLVALASYQIDRKQYDQARASLEQALALDAKQPNAYFQLGVIDLTTGRPQQAVERLERAIALDVDSPAFYLNLGIAYFQLQQVDKAIPQFRRALKLNQDLTVGRLLLAQGLAVSGSVEEAQTQYERVLKAEPRNAKALRGLGFCYIRQAKYVQAARTYQDATAAEPGSADGWAGLGHAYLGQEDYAAAEKAFAKARSIDPDNPTMKKGLELLAKAREAAAAGG
jgi:tetratricopeptide (TPR) repeat protein